MLVDFRHNPTSDDLLMYKFLKHYNIPVTIVATKVDKVGTTMQQKQRNNILSSFDLMVGDELILFSSVTKLGKNDVYEKIERTK